MITTKQKVLTASAVVIVGASGLVMHGSPADHNSIQPIKHSDNVQVQPTDTQPIASAPDTSGDPAPTTSVPATAPTSSAPMSAPVTPTKQLYTHSYDSADPSQTNPTLNFTTNNTWTVNLNYHCSVIPPQPLVFGVYSNSSDYDGSISTNVTAGNLSGVITKQYTEIGNFTIHGPDNCAWNLVITENL